MSFQCGKCGIEECALSMCGNCNRQQYCSKKCQKEDWKSHKKTCLLPECPICFELIEKVNSLTTECGHTFHTSCIMKNVARNGFSCPYCRAIMAESVAESQEIFDQDLPELEPSDTPENLWDINPNDWVVEDRVVSDRFRIKPSVDQITQRLVEQGITTRHFVQAFLKDHALYGDEEVDFMRVDDELFERIEEVIDAAQP